MEAVPGVTEEIIAAGIKAYKEANLDAFQTVYLCTLAFTGFGIIIAWWAPDTAKYMTTKIAATLHREQVVPTARGDDVEADD